MCVALHLLTVLLRLHQVLLCSVAPSSSSQQQCAEHIQGICNAYWLIRITADVPEAQAIPAAHAIGKPCYALWAMEWTKSTMQACLSILAAVTICFVLQDL